MKLLVSSVDYSLKSLERTSANCHKVNAALWTTRDQEKSQPVKVVNVKKHQFGPNRSSWKWQRLDGRSSSRGVTDLHFPSGLTSPPVPPLLLLLPPSGPQDEHALKRGRSVWVCLCTQIYMSWNSAQGGRSCSPGRPWMSSFIWLIDVNMNEASGRAAGQMMRSFNPENDTTSSLQMDLQPYSAKQGKYTCKQRSDINGCQLYEAPGAWKLGKTINKCSIATKTFPMNNNRVRWTLKLVLDEEPD